MNGPAASSGTDAVVVGASASGLLTAIRLANAGVRVRVIEQGTTETSASRTLIVTSHLRKFLPVDCQSCVVGEVSRFELYADGIVSEVTLIDPDLVIERNRLIMDLVGHARSRGVEVIERAKCVGLRHHGDRLVVRVGIEGAIEEFKPAYVIGADGSFSDVAKSVGLSRLPTVPLVQAVIETPADLQPGTSRIWFRPEDTSYFYWLIPEHDGRSVVGLVGDVGSAPRQRLDRFLTERALVPVEYQSARIPSSSRHSSLRSRHGSTRVFFVGDAAGHVKLSTVGGVVTGFAGAVATAEAILGRRPRRAFRGLELQLALHRSIRSVLGRFDLDDYRHLLLCLDADAVSILGTISRDDLGPLLRQLIRRRPQFLAIALRTLLRRDSSTYPAQAISSHLASRLSNVALTPNQRETCGRTNQ